MVDLPFPLPPGEGEQPTAVVGRYAIYDAIASGGMATVHLGRLIGTAGFLRTVAVKRLHPQYAKEKDFTAMFLDEARLAARVQHPNVVPTLDVVMDGSELLLVMEYVRGVSLSQLVRAARDSGLRLPPKVVVAIVSGALHGLHAAHEATDERGDPLDLVHRDVSPQNVLVGVDGVSRVLDFGIAKAAGRVHSTKEGEIKGKLLYMPPEQLAAEKLTRAVDIYAGGIVLFEALTNMRMFAGEQEHAAITRIVKNQLRLPSSIDPELVVFDALVSKAAAGEPSHRFATAEAFARALEQVMTPASSAEVGEWVKQLGAELLDERAKMVAHVERSSTRSKPPPGSSPGMQSPAALMAAQIGGALSQPGSGPVSGVNPTTGAPLTVPSSSGSMAAAPAISGTYTPSAYGNMLGDPRGSTTLSSGVASPLYEPAPAPRAKVGVAALIGALLALLFVAGVIIVALVLRPSTSASAPQIVPPSATQASPSATTAATDPPASAPVVTIASPSPTASPSAAVTPAKATAAPPVVRPVVSKPKVNCDPPYTIDKKGHRHFIPECVQ
jgi:eukaryotic-like serine/threonine-protein kinase